MFIDMHCHILPGIDDGADFISESVELAKQACESGTSVLVATPHINNPRRTDKHLSKDDITAQYRNLKSELIHKGIDVNILLGAEILCSDNLDYLYRKNEFLTLNGSRYILIEFDFFEKINSVYFYAEKLLSYGFIPVVAHPERYHFFEENPYGICRLLNDGCKIQINKGSPLGQYGSHAQKYSKWLLDNNFVHLIASDCHNHIYRNSDMRNIYEYLLNLYPTEKIMRLMHDNPKKILLDKNL